MPQRDLSPAEQQIIVASLPLNLIVPIPFLSLAAPRRHTEGP